MRYKITDDVSDAGVLVIVEDADGATITLRIEHDGHRAFIDGLRNLIAEYREEIWNEHVVEQAAVPVDVVDRRHHLAKMMHGSLLACVARAIEQELYEP